MNNFGKSFETMSDTYDPTTGVIKRDKSKLKVSRRKHGKDDILVYKTLFENKL